MGGQQPLAQSGQLEQLGDDSDAGVHVELEHDLFQVILDRIRADGQLLGDHLVAQALEQQPGDIPLPTGEVVLFKRRLQVDRSPP